MPYEVFIDHGSPFWESPSVIPSTQGLGSTSLTPSETAIHPGSTDVNVYVRVETTPTSAPIPGCPIGEWAHPVVTGLRRLPSGTVSFPSGSWTFKAGIAWPPTGQLSDWLDGPTPILIRGVPASGRRVYGFSPDNHWFAYIYGPKDATLDPNTQEFVAIVIALDGATHFDSSTINLGTPSRYPTVSTQTVRFNAAFDIANFGWVGSSGLWITGRDGSTPNQLRYLMCFRSTNATQTWPEPLIPASTIANYDHVASPCGRQLAVVQPGTAATPAPIRWISTEDAKLVDPLQLGGIHPISTNGQSARITTRSHSALGVEVNLDPTVIPVNPASLEHVDDPDDIVQFQALYVDVDRVLASTLGWATMTVRPIGWAATHAMAASDSVWVEVPNRTNWANLSESHWCLFAQTYAPTLGLSKVWTSASQQFPSDTDSRCAQNNVEIA